MQAIAAAFESVGCPGARHGEGLPPHVGLVGVQGSAYVAHCRATEDDEVAPTARHPRLRQVQVTAGPCVYDATHRVLEGRSWAEVPEQGGLGAHQAAACKTSRQGLGLELPVSAPSVRPSDAQARLLRLLDAPALVALRGRTVRDTCSTSAGDGSSLVSKRPQIAHRERACRPGGRQSRQPPRRQTRGREHSCVRCANS